MVRALSRVRARVPLAVRGSAGREPHVGGAGNWRGQTRQESRCRAFARHLLVPVEGLREFLGDQENVTLATLSAVVQRFLVSPAIAAVALEQAGYTDAATRQEWGGIYTPQLAARFGWNDQYRALQADSEQRRAPQRLLARAITGYAEGVLSAQAIATLRGVTLDEAEAELREAGVAPAEQHVAWAAASDLPDVDVDLDLDLVAMDDDLNTSDDQQDPAVEKYVE